MRSADNDERQLQEGSGHGGGSWLRRQTVHDETNDLIAELRYSSPGWFGRFQRLEHLGTVVAAAACPGKLQGRDPREILRVPIGACTQQNVDDVEPVIRHCTGFSGEKRVFGEPSRLTGYADK